MNLNVLILHETLAHTDEVLSDYRLYMTEPHIVHTLDEAMERVRRYQYSLIVVEVTPPWRHAAEPIAVLRAATDTPTLALVRGQDAVSFRHCLEVADDCVWEPFLADEVIARGLALVARGSNSERTPLAKKPIFCRELLITPAFYRAYIGRNELELTPLEYRILLHMALNLGRVLSKADIYTHAWNEDNSLDIDGLVSYHVHNIRHKLAAYSGENYIDTVWGVGFRLNNA